MDSCESHFQKASIIIVSSKSCGGNVRRHSAHAEGTASITRVLGALDIEEPSRLRDFFRGARRLFVVSDCRRKRVDPDKEPINKLQKLIIKTDENDSDARRREGVGRDVSSIRRGRHRGPATMQMDYFQLVLQKI